MFIRFYNTGLLPTGIPKIGSGWPTKQGTERMTPTETVKEQAFTDGFERHAPNPPKGQENLYAFHYQKGVDAENMQSAASEHATH